MNAGAARLAVSAHNVANWQTPGYRAYRAVPQEPATQRGVRARVVRTDQPPELATEMVEQMVTRRYVQANGTVARASIELLGTVLNIMA